MLSLLLVLGCTEIEAPARIVPSTEPAPVATPIPGHEVVSLETRDAVMLVADVWTTGVADSPAIVLLHMTPQGGFNRTDWPMDFVDQLRDEGFNVLAVDRRGSGESEGNPIDAFTGEFGRYDVEAAVLHLEGLGLGPIGLIGASNGTTSALDYARWAGSESLPEPFAIGFMTGGAYTESQESMDGLAIPSMFTFSTAERAWSVAQMDVDPGGWVFEEYAAGDHGTFMFDAAPRVKGDLVSFFAGAL